MKIKNFIFYSLFVIIFIFVVIGISFSYFKARIVNDEKSSTISIGGGVMSITYNGPGTDGNSDIIIANNIIPGWSVTKNFSLTAINDIETNSVFTDNTLHYKIGIVVEENTFSENSFTYELSSLDGGEVNGNTVNYMSGYISDFGTTIIGAGFFNRTNTEVEHNYELVISYPDNGLDQSGNNGKTFRAYVSIDI